GRGCRPRRALVVCAVGATRRQELSDGRGALRHRRHRFRRARRNPDPVLRFDVARARRKVRQPHRLCRSDDGPVLSRVRLEAAAAGGRGRLTPRAAVSGDPRGVREMVASDGFAEFLREQLAPLGAITLRRMFGKSGVFCDGVMLGMVTENTLYFRVDDENRATFKEAESSAPLNYVKQGSTI